MLHLKNKYHLAFVFQSLKSRKTFIKYFRNYARHCISDVCPKRICFRYPELLQTFASIK